MATEERKNKPEVEEKDVNSSEEVVETAIELSTEEVEEIYDIEELIQSGKDQQSSVDIKQGTGNLEESVLKQIKR